MNEPKNNWAKPEEASNKDTYTFDEIDQDPCHYCSDKKAIKTDGIGNRICLDCTKHVEYGTIRYSGLKFGRNDKCPCGSGQKVKRCPCRQKFVPIAP